MMDFNDGYHLGGYGMGSGWSWVIMLLLMLAAIGAVILFLRKYAVPPTLQEPKALDILNARYVKGELTQAEFEHMKKNIS